MDLAVPAEAGCGTRLKRVQPADYRGSGATGSAERPRQEQATRALDGTDVMSVRFACPRRGPLLPAPRHAKGRRVRFGHGGRWYVQGPSETPPPEPASEDHSTPAESPSPAAIGMRHYPAEVTLSRSNIPGAPGRAPDTLICRLAH